VASTQYWLLVQAESLTHLATQVPVDEHTKPNAQSAGVAQLVLQEMPEQMKLPLQLWGLRNVHTPIEQEPGSITLVPEQLVEPHDPVGNEQVLFAWQVPLQAASAPGAVEMHSVSPQQPLVGMHAPLLAHTLKPDEIGQPHTPAPVQVRGPPHAVGVARLHTPVAEQVPVPPLCVLSVHLRAPQGPLVGKAHFPLLAQTPLQAASVAPLQSVSMQQLPAGMQPPLHGVKFIAQVEQRPAPEHWKPA